MNIAIVGCAGYIGSNLVHYLCRDPKYKDSKIVGIDNLYFNQAGVVDSLCTYDNFTFHYEDVRNNCGYILQKQDIIIWLAAIVGEPLCKKVPELAQQVNYDAVKLNLPWLHKSIKVIFPNTNSGYGIGGKEMCTEESPMNPISLYGTTKVEAEKVVMDRENSVSYRLATVFGRSPRPRMDLLVNTFTGKLFFDGKLSIFDPQFRRNFVHNLDVCRAMEWAICPNFKGIYNLGDPNGNFTKMDLAKAVAKIVNPEAEITVGNGEDPDKRDYEISNQKVILTGFEFKYSLEDGVKSVMDLCRLHGEDVMRMGNV